MTATDDKPVRMAYTIKEASAMTGIPVSTLYELCATGQLPCKQVGRRKFIRTEDLRAFLHSP